MEVALIGGGINGLCTAWMLAQKQHQVTLYERAEIMQATSRASSKLLHGGLRYLENLEFRLVREALRERAWWIQHVPHLAEPLKLYLPVYDWSKRPAWKIQLGLTLYDVLAGKRNIARHRKLALHNFKNEAPELLHNGLIAGFTFFDGRMDDYQLGIWVAQQAKKSGVEIREFHEVIKFDTDGRIFYHDLQHGRFQEAAYDKVINITGPWADQLLNRSNISLSYSIDPIRGTHIVLPGNVSHGYLLEVPVDGRALFVLPYKGKILVGTTEVRQSLNEAIVPSSEEIDYLLNAYNCYFQLKRKQGDIVDIFSGVRPLIHSNMDPARATREYAIEMCGNVLTVFGGKWTTARALARNVVRELEANTN